MAGKDYENVIQSGEDGDLGIAIQGLIDDNIKALGTSWLAEITSIKENKVSVKQVIRSADEEQELIVNDCLVLFPFSQLWQTQFKLKVGDIGICLVLNKDITLYKANGKAVLANTKRFKNINDSIFIPASLFKSLNNDDVNFLIQSDNGNEISFDNDSNFKLVSKGNADVLIEKDTIITNQGTITSTFEKDFTQTIKGAVTNTFEKEVNQTFKGATTENLDDKYTKTIKGAVEIEGKDKITIKSGALATIKSKNPIEIGTDAGTLKAAFDAVFSAMDLIASGMTGASTNPAAYQGGKTAFTQQISKIVG